MGDGVGKEASLSNLITKIDYNKVANLANNKANNRAKIGGPYQRFKEAKKTFNSVNVHYVPRHCNVFAHSLTKNALRSLKFVIWLNELLI